MERSKRNQGQQKKLSLTGDGLAIRTLAFGTFAGILLVSALPAALADSSSSTSPSPFVSPMAPSASPKAPATGKDDKKGGTPLDNGPHAQAEPPIQATQPIQAREPIQPRQ